MLSQQCNFIHYALNVYHCFILKQFTLILVELYTDENSSFPGDGSSFSMQNYSNFARKKFTHLDETQTNYGKILPVQSTTPFCAKCTVYVQFFCNFKPVGNLSNPAGITKSTITPVPHAFLTYSVSTLPTLSFYIQTEMSSNFVTDQNPYKRSYPFATVANNIDYLIIFYFMVSTSFVFSFQQFYNATLQIP